MNIKQFFAGLLVGLCFVGGSAYAATVLMPPQGGTGNGTMPTTGQILVGNASSTYTPSTTWSSSAMGLSYDSLNLTASGQQFGTLNSSTNWLGLDGSQFLYGATASSTKYPNAKFIVSNGDAGVYNPTIMGIIGEATSTDSLISVGVIGTGMTKGTKNSIGVAGVGKVSSITDTADVYGLRGIATDVRTSGNNWAVVGSASGGSANYGVYGSGSTTGTSIGYGVYGTAHSNNVDTADAFGGYFQSNSYHASGTNIGVWSSAVHGGTNYSFYGNGGEMYNNGAASFLAPFKISSSDKLGDYFFVSSTGVGIGTVSPNEKLDVYGNVRLLTNLAGAGIFGHSAAGTQIFSLTRQNTVANGSLALNAYGGIGFVSGNISNSPTDAFQMFLDTTGKLGVGTTLPAAYLHITSATVDGSTAVASIIDTATTWSTGGSKLLSLRNNTVEKANINKDGGAYFNDSVGIGIASPLRTLHTRSATNAFRMDRGDATVPTVLLIDYSNSTFATINQSWGFGGTGTANFNISDFGVAVSGNGTPRITVQRVTGNVGIGVTAPTALLHLGTGSATVAPLKFTSSTLLTIPQGGALEFSNDRFYLTNVSSRRAIDRTDGVSLTDVTVTNTTTESIIYTGIIGANDLKVGNVLELSASGIVSSTSASDVATFKIKVGGTTMATITSPGSVLSGANWHFEGRSTVRSVGASGSMAYHLDLQVETNSNDAGAVISFDSTVAENITITVQWNNAKTGNSVTLHQGMLSFKN